jgi:predicted nucleotidyltransferase
MIRHKRLPADIGRRLERAAEYLQAHPRVVFAYLFGGLAKAHGGGPLSDVDIAVYLSSRQIARTKLSILGRLSSVLATDEVDLVVLNTSPPTLTKNVLRHKRILVDKEPTRRHAFESLAFRKYFDFQPFERRLLEKRVHHGG